MLAATVSAATLLVATSLLAEEALRAAGERVVARNSLGEEVTEVQSKACSEYPSLKFKMPKPVLHSNLARQGPDRGGAAGIVYDAVVDPGRGAGSELGRQHVYLIIDATSSHYKPFSPELNGVQGEYGSVNLQQGNGVDLRFRFYDHSGARRQLLRAAFTFFNLHTGGADASVESVTLGKHYKHYHLTADTEVRVEDLGDRIRFSGSTQERDEDHPTHPTFARKHRAVTVTFEHLHELQVTLRAGAGVGPHFFTFAGRPSLMCEVTAPEGFSPPLDDIVAQPPLQRSVQSDCCEPERFGTMLVSVGQDVKAGDGVFTVTKSDSSTKTYATPIDGKVKAVQAALVFGDDLKTRLHNKTVAIIEKPQSEPLLSTLLAAIPAHAQGPLAETGDRRAAVTEVDGAAPAAVQERHGRLRRGTGTETLPTRPGGGALSWALERWDKAVPASVEQDDLVAVVKHSVTGEERELRAERRGTAVESQEGFYRGNESLAVSGQSRHPREKGADARLNGVFAQLYHIAGEGGASSDGIMLAATDCKSNSSGTDGCVAQAGSSRWWQLGQACVVMLLCIAFCRFYCLMKKPLPSYTNMGGQEAESESEETVSSSSSDDEGMRLDFEDEQKFSHTVYAKWRPLGIKHTFTAPIVVRDFTANSYARQELGIQQGWKLTRIGDKQLHESPDFKAVSLEVNKQMEGLPLWPLALEFSPDEESRDRKLIKFQERPIGLIFKNRAPIEVEQVFAGSPAEGAGVEEGWFVTKIGDFDVTPTTTFPEAIAAFKEGVAALDDLGKRYGANNNDANAGPGS